MHGENMQTPHRKGSSRPTGLMPEPSSCKATVLNIATPYNPPSEKLHHFFVLFVRLSPFFQFDRFISPNTVLSYSNHTVLAHYPLTNIRNTTN